MAEIQIAHNVNSFIASHRVARLATVDANGIPHAIPICYAFDGTHVYSALDLKPKKVDAHQLKRVRNILENPHVALVIDDYSEDWSDLAYVLIRGAAEILEDGEERSYAESLLRDKYSQYSELLESGCTVLKITLESVTSWGRI